MTNTINWDKGDDGIVTLTIDDPNQRVNTMNADFQSSLQATVQRLEDESDDITGVILTSGKQTFFAGGDLRLMYAAGPDDAQQVYEEVAALGRAMRRMETLGKPVVAAINGSALGGGLEIALACHHRIAVDNPKTLIGLPEVTLGLLPGAGGCVRVPRLLGIMNGLLNVLVQGQQMKVAKARDVGVVDAIVPDVDTAIAEFGRVDIVVNNVGGAMPSAFLDTSEWSFDTAMRFNVTSAFNLTQLAVPHLLESDGASVVNIASSAGQFAIRGMSAYGTAKAALIHLTRELAQDLSPKVRVNAVSPGAIATSALDIVLQTPELHDAMLDGTPMRRLGDPDDIAAAVLFLASPAASYVTGEVLAVNGGIQGSNLELGLPDL